MSTNNLRLTGKGSMYLSLCVAAALSQMALTQNAIAAQDSTSAAASDNNLEELVVTGYRKSLNDSTNFKKESLGFVDGVFAEDMGKFPDTNVAESLNRVPGVTISREITGEGVNVSIRGLGTNFVKVLLNNAPIAVASTGTTDSQNTNREVDLDVLPTEFFTQLTVSKTPDASTLEGGSSGTVNMRSLRAFDNPGLHFAYTAQDTKESTASSNGERGTFLVSNTMGSFGILAGISGQHNKTEVRGFETIGWTNYNLSTGTIKDPTASTYNPNAQCYTDQQACNSTGGGNPGIPATVPVGSGAGLNAGDTVNQTYLLAHNPGLSITQIDNAIFPRLGRPTDEFGDRERVNVALSLEYKPSDNLYLYMDSMYGRKHNNMQRIDMDFVGRNGATIPTNMKVDRSDCTGGCVVTSATFANSQFFLEYRPYTEDTTFWNFNPGLEWKANDFFKLDFQLNRSYSDFHRQSPSVLVSTPTGANIAVNYVNNGDIPTFSSSLNLDDPTNFGWNAGSRVNIQDELRWTATKGFRTNMTFGGQEFNVRIGAAYDDIARQIRAIDNSQAWQNAVCGDNPSVYLPSPNSQPSCAGLSTTTQPGGYSTTPAYPGLGTNYSTGYPALTWAGSLIPQSSVQNYLMPGPAGFITVNWNKFAADSNYYAFHANAPGAGSSNTAANQGFIEEKTKGEYAEINGDTHVGDNRLKYSVGVRWVQTNQVIAGQVQFADPRNPPDSSSNAIVHATFLASDGGRYPNVNNFNATTNTTYSNTLPSVELAFYATDNAVFKAAASKTMTRPNPNTMLPGLNFSDVSAASATLGNPALQPYATENLDFGFEYYTGKEGYVGMMAFRKRLTNFPQSQVTRVPFSLFAQYGVTYDTLTPSQQQGINSNGGPGAAMVNLTQQVNVSGSAQVVNGIEFNWVQPLDFLLEGIGLKGLGFTANYTIVDQNATGPAVPPITGVPPHTFNLTAYYENHGVSIRMSEVYNYANLNAAAPQQGITQAALFTDTYRQWDLSSSFDLGKLFGLKYLPELTFDIQNVFDAKQRTYSQFQNATFTEYNPGRFYLLGVRQKF